MGQIKNIKLHIVTDIKTIASETTMIALRYLCRLCTHAHRNPVAQKSTASLLLFFKILRAMFRSCKQQYKWYCAEQCQDSNITEQSSLCWNDEERSFQKSKRKRK